MAESRRLSMLLRRFGLALIAAALGWLIAVVDQLSGEGLFDEIENASYDWRLRTLFEWPEDSSVAIVDIDEASLRFANREWFLRWPFERQVYDSLLRACQRAGAKAVVFDILFSEDDDYDPDFAAALAAHGNAYLAYHLISGSENNDAPWPVADNGLATGSSERAALPPVAMLHAAARGGGHADMQADADGVLRRNQLLIRHAGSLLPALGLAPLLGGHGPSVSINAEGIVIDGKSVPLDPAGRFVVPWRPLDGPDEIPRVPFAMLVSDQDDVDRGIGSSLAPEVLGHLRDKVVFVGASAAGGYDMRASPWDHLDLGVRYQASVYDALAQGLFVRESSPWLDLLLAALLTIGVASAAVLLPRVAWQIPAAVLVMGLHSTVVLWWFSGDRLWVSWIAPQVGALLALSTGSAFNYLSEGRARRRIRNAFQHYLAPVVVHQLEQDPGALALGGERREITALFTDLAGFTTLSESLDPESVVALLNEYLTEMCTIIMAEGGTVDKFEGDAIIAMFGAPIEASDHAASACRAALLMQRRLAELVAEWQAQGRPPLAMRVGINTGEAVVGNMGSKDRFDYTMIGDAVNLAARLEGANKAYASGILVSQATRDHAGEALRFQELDRLRVKGKAVAVPVHTVIGLAGEAVDEELDGAFACALQRYREQDFTAAGAAFAALVGRHDSAEIYMQRCQQLAANPPGPDWDGAFTMTTK